MASRIPADAPKTQGRAALAKHLSGARLTQQQAIHAKCCDCSGYYRDGRIDCRVSSCPLYPWMPYRQDGPATAVDPLTGASAETNADG
jgi:hypothetical protein